jgi:signal transduction histidine kinase
MAALLRPALFGLLTVLAALVGRSTSDEALGISLVWPLYGVGVLWIASGSRATRPWDTLGLGLLTGATILADTGDPPLVVVSVLLVVLTSWTWVLVTGWLQPDRSALSRPRTLWDLVVVLTASATSALFGAVLRTWGMGLLPTYDLETFLLLMVRNCSGILGPVSVGVLLLPYLRSGGRAEVRRVLAERADAPGRWVVEVVVMLALAAFLVREVFSGAAAPMAFTLVLLVVWASFRVPPVAAVALALVIGTAGVVATLRDRGQFEDFGGEPFTAAATAQAFLITLVLAALAIAIDVEERRRATERARAAEQVAEARATLFSTVVEHLDEGVTVITSDDDYTLRNRAAQRLTGLGGFLRPDPDDAGQPQMLDDAGVPIPVPEMPHSRARAEGRVVRETVRLRSPSGVERRVEISSIPIPGLGEDQRPVVVNTLRDVTAGHEERDQLVSFAGVVAHDLKNPLTVIRGWSESLQEELASDAPPDVAALRSMVARVVNASDQMRSFIDDLLGITVARDRRLELETVDLSALAEEVAELRRAGDTLPRISVQPGMWVTGDRFLVRQLLDNLVGNAVKYVASGVRPAVVVTARTVDGQLEVAISDNGIGIPADQRERIFDSFVRAHAEGYTGTGLGLAICQRVVDRHGGRIRADEAPGGGTRISFTLPIAQRRAEPVADVPA